MNTTSMLESILNDDYGVGSLVAGPTTVIWAAERLADRLGIEEAKRQLAELNQLRERRGMIPACPDYGTLLF